MIDDIEELPASETEPAESLPTAAAPKKTSKARKKGRKRRRRDKDNHPAYRDTILRFQACGRCSYFLADCQVQFGRDTVQEAISQNSDSWIELDWSEKLRRMLREAYAISDAVDFVALEGICSECTRPFTFDSEGDDDHSPFFRIRI